MFKKNKVILLFFFIFLIVSCGHVQVRNSHKNKQIKKVLNIQSKIKFKQIFNNIKPGEVSFIKIKSYGLTNLLIRCNSKTVPFALEDNQIILVLGESYFSKRKYFNCLITNNKKKIYKLTFSVLKKEYPKENLNVDKKRVVLSPKNLRRYLREKKILNKAYKKASQKILFYEKFQPPLTSKITSYYGTKRIFNNFKKTQHLGNDFRAKTGTEIPAVNSGKIIFAGDLFFTGGTIIINHGLNIFSIYGHLSKLKVKSGDTVNKGQIVALSGASGRVTGPHLHWGVKIGGHYIDGFSLIDKSIILSQKSNE